MDNTTPKNKVFFASDHGGFELKNKLISYVKELGYEVIDKGADQFDSGDDYPEIIAGAAREVSKNDGSMGIILGGSGQGEAIVANRFPNVRAIVFYNTAVAKSAVDITGRMSDDSYEIVKLARLHNNANIISLSSRFLSEDEAKQAIKIFLETQFSGDERHIRRIDQIEKLSK
jgi:ribose 5-phosphate isomerase B